MTNLKFQDNQWYVSGEILMDNANAVLAESKLFNVHDDLQINLSKVTDVDTAALSLLMEWQRRVNAAGKKISFSHLPDSLMSLAKLYGVADFISASSK